LPGIAPEDEGRAVELLEDARGDNADDADVPGHLAFDNDEVGLRVEPGAQGADDFVGDGAFDLLALAVVGVELLGDGQRLREVGGQEEAEGVFGGFEAARGVESGRELEADFVSAKRVRGLSDSFQGDQAGAAGGVEAFQAGGNEDAVFAGERDNVGDGAEGNEVKQGAQVEAGCAGQAGIASALEEGVGELEGKAGGAEFGEEGGLGLGVGVGAGGERGLTRAVAAGAGEETW